MKTPHALAICAILTCISSIKAAEDKAPHPSPDGSVTIRNIGNTASPDHHFQIVNRNGDVLLASDKHPDLESGSFAEGISWSPDNRFVAFSVRTSGPYIRDTFVYSVKSNRLLRIPTEEDDAQTRPVRWHNAKMLIVQTSAPFGGKAGEEKELASYRYRRTIRITEGPLRLETLYATPRIRPKP